MFVVVMGETDWKKLLRTGEALEFVQLIRDPKDVLVVV